MKSLIAAYAHYVVHRVVLRLKLVLTQHYVVVFYAFTGDRCVISRFASPMVATRYAAVYREEAGDPDVIAVENEPGIHPENAALLAIAGGLLVLPHLPITLAIFGGLAVAGAVAIFYATSLRWAEPSLVLGHEIAQRQIRAHKQTSK